MNRLLLYPRKAVAGASGLWLFNEGSGTTLTDYSGRGNRGTFGNAPRAPTWTTAGLSFDGGDLITCTAANPSQIAAPALSVFAVIYTASSANHGGIFEDYGSSATSRSWQIKSGSTATTLTISISTDGTNAAKTYTVASALNDSTWKTVGFVFNAGTLDIYINATKQTPTKAVDNACPTIWPSAEGVRFGHNKNSDVYGTLSMGIAKIFPFALSSTQIVANQSNFRRIMATRGVTLA